MMKFESEGSHSALWRSQSDKGRSRCVQRPSSARFVAAGSTLIELLVVIVVFLIGILAVVQIFPKGFQLLTITRTNSVAAHMAEDEVERLKQHADQMPQEILAVHYVNGVPVQDASRDPYDLGPQGDAIDQNGLLSVGGSQVGSWLLYSGPNSFRRIVAEGSRVPAPRPVGVNYGGLMVLNFGPIDSKAPISAYANDFAKDLVLPTNLELAASSVTVTAGLGSIPAALYDTPTTLSPTEYFVTDSTNGNAALLLPTNPSYNRTYHLRLSAYLQNGATTIRQDFPDLLLNVPLVTATNAAGNVYPLVSVPVSGILSALNQLGGGSLVAIDFDSVQVAPEYAQIATATNFSNDPLQYKLLDPNVGVLLFNPVAFSTMIEHAGGAREPLQARVSYDVYDWRILRQEFRLDGQQGLNGGNYGQFALALQSIKVGSSSGPDGLLNGGILPIESTSAPAAASQIAADDNFVLVDLITGGVVYELDPATKNTVITVNKSTGLVTVNPVGSGAGLMGNVAIPGTSTPTLVNLAGRPLRALYRARQEFSVSVLKAAASYSLVEPPTSSTPLAEGQVYTPDGFEYVFPKSDVHQQVVFDTINYTDASGGYNILHGQSFVIQPTPTTPLPQVNLKNVLPAGATVTSVSGIKGSSVVVQVLWNPDSFRLGANPATNIASVNTWEHGWRRNTNQTTIPTQELQ